MPHAALTRRRIVFGVLFVTGTIAVLYLVLPRLAGLDETWRRASQGDRAWLAAALLFECLSFAGYVLLFRAVFARGGAPIGWRISYQITMAGVVATRLLATAGAGGVALTAWALHRTGLDARRVTVGLTTFLVLLYSVYMAALVAGGLGLRTGLLAGAAPFGLTAVPAMFGATVIAVALTLALVRRSAVPGSAATAASPLRRGAPRARPRRSARACGMRSGCSAPGIRGCSAPSRGGPLSIAVLWACLKAFGGAPPVAVVVTAYFVGMLGNLLPLPGGVGGVDGGMIAALIGFGVDEGLAIVGVLVYRGFAFWLPIVPGAVAYVQLVRTVSHRRDGERAPSPCG